ncbi:glycoside hydrolase family 76 protein [Paenibacillus swuensis]|uniref:glycoside hydrolase family 76 protein n=1 Tax=Paenibacillus swuensis TaxID=1178515 RepID=UPI0008380535|nr:glycoside hydrolase family 76 protein [Paenibacillus swuensis]
MVRSWNLRKCVTGIVMTAVVMTSVWFVNPQKASAFSSADADAAMTAFNSKFYNSQTKWFYANTNRNSDQSFWVEAHMWNLVMDAYERTNNPAYLTQINDMYSTLVARHGHDWTWNTWNDDIMWWALAATRAYELTGNEMYKNDAKSNLDWVLDTQTDQELGGGVWEHNDSHYDKNSCINFPTVITAVKMSNLLNDNSYLTEAQNIYSWAKSALTDGNGKVYDAIRTDGTTDMGSSHYNQGTFIGAAVALYEETGIIGYLNDAVAAANWTINNLTTNNILNFESHVDLQGGKLIFLEYLNKLIIDGGRTEFRQWFVDNAQTAWDHRNSENLVWGDWNQPTSGTFSSWAAAPAVAALNLLGSGTPSTGSPISIANPGFESGNLSGWSEWHPAGQSAKYGIDSNDAHSGNYKLYFYDSAAYQQSIHQVKTGLANGSYTLKAWVKATAYGAAPYTVRMEGRYYGGADVYANMTVDGVWRQYTMNVSVSNGQLDIGFYVNSPGMTSMQIDDVTLTKN